MTQRFCPVVNIKAMQIQHSSEKDFLNFSFHFGNCWWAVWKRAFKSEPRKEMLKTHFCWMAPPPFGQSSKNLLFVPVTDVDRLR